VVLGTAHRARDQPAIRARVEGAEALVKDAEGLTLMSRVVLRVVALATSKTGFKIDTGGALFGVFTHAPGSGTPTES